jgi:ketosteroid isomerase-like protein
MLTTKDRLDIADTLALQAHVIDADQIDRIDEFFTPDAVYDMSGPGVGVFEGIDAIRAAAAQMSAGGHGPIAHFLTNVVLTSTSKDEATAQSKCLMIMASGATSGVTYEDTLRRDRGHWRISHRRITPAGRPAARLGDH